MENTTSVAIDRPKAGIKTSVLAIGLLFIALVISILFGNALVMISIRRFRRLQTLTNRLVFSLALSDFVNGILIIWQSCFSWFPQLETSGIACRFRFLNIQAMLCSPMNLVIVAVDRYLAVLHPLRYHEFMTPRLVNILLGVAWATSTALTALVIGTIVYIPGVSICYLPDIVPDVVNVFVFQVVITLLIVAMFVIYGQIFWAARKHMHQIHPMASLPAGQIDSGKRMIKELKAAKQLFAIILVFFFCHAVFLVVLALGYYDNIMPIAIYMINYKASLIIMFFNSAINPIVYALKSKAFREAFKRIVCRYVLLSEQNNDTLVFSD
jgi:hypothetical protein